MRFKLILDGIRMWLKRRRLTCYGLRPAAECDLDFIMEEIVDGAKNGHYAASLLDPRQINGLREQFERVINSSTMVRATDRGIEKIHAELFVYCSKKDDQVGYVFVSEKYPGSINEEVELYKAGVKESHRGEGHGRRIVELFVSCSHPSVKLYARCFQSSAIMFLLLQEFGFSHFNTMPYGTRELERCAIKSITKSHSAKSRAGRRRRIHKAGRE